MIITYQSCKLFEQKYLDGTIIMVLHYYKHVSFKYSECSSEAFFTKYNNLYLNTEKIQFKLLSNFEENNWIHISKIC